MSRWIFYTGKGAAKRLKADKRLEAEVRAEDVRHYKQRSHRLGKCTCPPAAAPKPKCTCPAVLRLSKSGAHMLACPIADRA